MEKRQVLLICLQPLLSEGLRRIFQALEDVDLVQITCSDPFAVVRILDQGQPDVIVIAGEQEDEASEHLVTMLLNRCLEVPIIWVALEDSALHMYSSRVLPANSAGLLDAIRHLATSNPPRKKIPPNPQGGDIYEI